MAANRCPDSKQVRNLDHKRIHHLIFDSRILGESPPPAPRACFGRDKLIEKIVDLANNLTPVALVGAGGIGKTSIALTVLHHDRVRQRFGDNRRFIRCDQFTVSCAHLLSRLSEAISAGIENPKDFTSLRPFLSSKEVFIVLDNAESILDPGGMDAQDIYAVVEELSQLNSVWLCISSRISTIPPDCETLDIPTLSIEAARDTFYRIYKNDERSGVVDNILDELDFHPLSITLLATVAHHNKWDTGRLTREWEAQRTNMLKIGNHKSLAATIELSLDSPMFQQLGPDARALLEVVAFFPQGVNENNADWLFPTISNRTEVFDKFCTLSLTYRSNGFIAMLAPLRDHLSPKDPQSSPLLCTTRRCYFTRMAIKIDLDEPNLEDTQWITSEDANVEHLLDISTTADPNLGGVWDVCANFIEYLAWHKKRPTILQAKIEGLPDDHRFKSECLFQLMRLSHELLDFSESKRFASHALTLWRERGDPRMVTAVLRHLANANLAMGLSEEGMLQVKEALEICERLGDTAEQAQCLTNLALLLQSDSQLDAAEATALRAIDLLPETGKQYMVCDSHQALGIIYNTKGETKKAIHHFEAAFGIASTFNWHDHLFWANYGLALLFLSEDRFEDAHTHAEHARLHAAGVTSYLGLAADQQARIWYRQHRLEEARTEALRAADIYDKLGASENTEWCRRLLRDIEEELNTPVASASNCELL